MLLMLGPASAGLMATPDPDRLDPDADAEALLPLLNGESLWESRYAGPASGNHRASAMAVHPTGLLTYVTGTSPDATNDYATIAHEALTGTPVWEARYDGPEGGHDQGSDIAVDPDGARVYVTGTSPGQTGSGIATVAYNALTGLELWSAHHVGSGSGPSNTASVAVSPDGDQVYVTGTTGSWAGSAYATVAYDAGTGDVQWTASYPGPSAGENQAQGIAVAPDGDQVFVTGWSFSTATSYDYATVSYDTQNGDELWVARYDGPASEFEFPRAIDVSEDGERVFVTGGSSGIGTGFDVTTVAYDATTGQEDWVARYDGPRSSSDSAWDVAVGSDGNVYATSSSWGTTSGLDYATIAYDGETGETIWVSRYNGPSGATDHGESIAVSPDGTRVYATGYSFETGAGFDYATVAYDAENGVQQWVMQYDGTGGSDFPSDVAVDPLGLRLYVTGRSAGTNGDEYATIAYAAR